jgi:hypothetical protein
VIAEQELLEIEHALATGGGDEWALMSSAYMRDDGSWKLVLHQQTPLWET